MIKNPPVNRQFPRTASGKGTRLLLAPPAAGAASQLSSSAEPVEVFLGDPTEAWLAEPGGAAGTATPRPRTAADLRQEVLAALRSEPRLARSTVGVLTLEGVVILTGYADTDADAALAERLAYGVGGVQCVISHLVVRHPSAGHLACAPEARPSTPF